MTDTPISLPVRVDASGNMTDANGVLLAVGNAAKATSLAGMVNLVPYLNRVRTAAREVLNLHEDGQRQGGLAAMGRQNPNKLLAYIDQFGASFRELEQALASVDEETVRFRSRHNPSERE